MVALAIAAVVAVLNRLAIGGPQAGHLDALFSLAQLVELLAAAAFLARTALAAEPPLRGGFCSFAHALLPAQQLLGAYFLLAAWGSKPLEEVEGLVGEGYPFKVLQLAGAAQVGLYLAAAAWHFSTAVGSKTGSASPAVAVDDSVLHRALIVQV